MCLNMTLRKFTRQTISSAFEHNSYIIYHGLTLRMNNGEYSTLLKRKRTQYSQSRMAYLWLASFGAAVILLSLEKTNRMLRLIQATMYRTIT